MLGSHLRALVGLLTGADFLVSAGAMGRLESAGAIFSSSAPRVLCDDDDLDRALQLAK